MCAVILFGEKKPGLDTCSYVPGMRGWWICGYSGCGVVTEYVLMVDKSSFVMFRGYGWTSCL